MLRADVTVNLDLQRAMNEVRALAGGLERRTRQSLVRHAQALSPVRSGRYRSRWQETGRGVENTASYAGDVEQRHQVARRAIAAAIAEIGR